MRGVVRGPNKARLAMAIPALSRCVGLWVVMGAMCAGCIVIPTNFHLPESRKNVSEKTTVSIIPGQTMKEEVFLTLGEPDYVSPDGRRLVYSWSKVKAIWIVGGIYTAMGGNVAKDYSLIITFDEHDVVLQKEFQGQYRLGISR